MARKTIVKFGSDILRTPSKRVEKFDRKLEKLVNDMLHTMYAENGVGLAAPQIGINQRVLIIDTEWAEEDGERNPIVLVNPSIVFKAGQMESAEGCLSFPDVYFSVSRASKVVVKYYDLKGKEQRIEAEENLMCRCLQHEIDHLDGKLFVDIAQDKIKARAELDKNGFAGIDSKPQMIL